MLEESKYQLGKGTKVRKESFGLLFYSSDGPRLLFIGCKDLIPTEFFEGKQFLRELLDSLELDSYPKIRQELLKTIKYLLEKGIIIRSESQ
ncbi:MAG: mycofactocin biosynthesis chaperone MftB [candidate division WOR-3 bacterium]